MTSFARRQPPLIDLGIFADEHAARGGLLQHVAEQHAVQRILGGAQPEDLVEHSGLRRRDQHPPAAVVALAQLAAQDRDALASVVGGGAEALRTEAIREAARYQLREIRA